MDCDYRDSATGGTAADPLGAIEPAGKKDAFHVALARGYGVVRADRSHIDPKGTDVATVCRDYVAELRGKGREKGPRTTRRGRFRRLVYDRTLGAIDRDQLKRTHLVQWFAAQLPSDKTDAEDNYAKRRTARIATAPRWSRRCAGGRQRQVARDFAWRAFKPHGKVGARRNRLLDRAQRKRLLQPAGVTCGILLKGLLLACRPGELANASVADFDRKAGSLVSGKTGRRVVECRRLRSMLFTRSKGRIGAAALLARESGERWDRFSWRDGIHDAVKTAKLPRRRVRLHVRHTSISEMLSGGVDPLTVSRLSGTSLTMIQKHYGHLVRSGLCDKLDAVRLV